MKAFRLVDKSGSPSSTKMTYRRLGYSSTIMASCTFMRPYLRR